MLDALPRREGNPQGPFFHPLPRGVTKPLPVPGTDSCAGWGRVSRAGLGVGRNHPRMLEGHCLLRASLLRLASASSLSSEAEERMKTEAPPDAKNPRCTVPQRNTESRPAPGLLQCLPPPSPPHPSNKDPQLGCGQGGAGHWHGQHARWLSCFLQGWEGKVCPKPPPCFPNGLSTAIRHITGVTRHLFLAWTETLLWALQPGGAPRQPCPGTLASQDHRDLR